MTRPASPAPDIIDAVEWLPPPGPDAPQGDVLGAMADLLLGIARRRRARQADHKKPKGKMQS